MIITVTDPESAETVRRQFAAENKSAAIFFPAHVRWMEMPPGHIVVMIVPHEEPSREQHASE